MSNKVILVPSDGATNIKLEVFDFDTLKTLHADSSKSPAVEYKGLKCNCTAEEFEWFDKTISKLPQKYKNAVVISPVARGASGGLVDNNNNIIDVDNGKLTIAYTQDYPDNIESKFREICISEEKYFNETGSILALPGSLSLIKRLLFEQMERSEIAERAKGFAPYSILMAGHFLGDDFLKAIELAGNEHSYWMCHSGARNINKEPGTPSSICDKIELFWKLVPRKTAVSYKAIGCISGDYADKIGIKNDVTVTPGGHDTCLSHIPIISTFYQAFSHLKKNGVFHLEIGTWIMGAQLNNLGADLCISSNSKKGTMVQGTVDGVPVPTTMYGGGADYRTLVEMAKKRNIEFDSDVDTNLLNEVLQDNCCFILPNIDPNNHGTGPFPELEGKIINEDYFYSSGRKAFLVSNLMTALTASYQISGLLADNTSIVLTGGGAKNDLFGSLLATLTGHDVYIGYDKFDNIISETTSLGAAIVGKASCLNIHPYDVDVSSIGVKYRKLAELSDELKTYLKEYKESFFKTIKENCSCCN
ncbi:MAG TPA: hypothetical protein QF753_04700 [Victivallales bacterium]|nr:hypothetical protein [Victivallales bacterium]